MKAISDKIITLLKKNGQYLYSEKDFVPKKDCIPAEIIYDYLNGSLSFLKELKIKKHISKCLHCLKKVAEYSQELAVLEQQPATKCPEHLMEKVRQTILSKTTVPVYKKETVSFPDLLEKVKLHAMKYLENLDFLENLKNMENIFKEKTPAKEHVVSEHRMSVSHGMSVSPLPDGFTFDLGTGRSTYHTPPLYKEKKPPKIPKPPKPPKEKFKYFKFGDGKLELKLKYEKGGKDIIAYIEKNKFKWSSMLFNIQMKDGSSHYVTKEVGKAGTQIILFENKNTDYSPDDIKKIEIISQIEKTIPELLDKSKQLLKRELISNGVETISEVLAREKNNPDALLLKSIAFALENKWDDALSSIDKIRRIGHEDKQVKEYLEDIMKTLQQVQQKEKILWKK